MNADVRIKKQRNSSTVIKKMQDETATTVLNEVKTTRMYNLTRTTMRHIMTTITMMDIIILMSDMVKKECILIVKTKKAEIRVGKRRIVDPITFLTLQNHNKTY